jgi:hypothetical protein
MSWAGDYGSVIFTSPGAGTFPGAGFLKGKKMATTSIVLSLGAANAGKTLVSQIVGTDGVDIGSEISSGITELGNGFYIASIEYPEETRAFLKFYESGDPTKVVAVDVIPPPEGRFC